MRGNSNLPCADHPAFIEATCPHCSTAEAERELGPAEVFHARESFLALTPQERRNVARRVKKEGYDFAEAVQEVVARREQRKPRRGRIPEWAGP